MMRWGYLCDPKVLAPPRRKRRKKKARPLVGTMSADYSLRPTITPIYFHGVEIIPDDDPRRRAR